MENLLNKLKVIGDVLGDDDNKFYVYGLFDKNDFQSNVDNPKPKVPFYIGKGQGTRIVQHIRDTETSYALLDSIIDEIVNDEELTCEEIENLKKKSEGNYVSEKCQEIQNLIENNQLEMVIFKWGLTAQEAYMCESALINAYNLTFGKDRLKNIVNGHASKREKATFKNTEALTINKFEEKCKKPIEFKNHKKETNIILSQKCVFINIPKLYQKELSNDELQDIVRGCWRVDRDKKPTYVIAMCDSVIQGIYKYDGCLSIYKMSEENFPEFPPEKRTAEKNLINAMIAFKNSKENSAVEISKLNKTSDLYKCFESYCKAYKLKLNQKNYDSWECRKFYITQIIESSNDDKDEVSDAIKKLIHTRMYKTKDNKMLSIHGQNPIRYNF